VKRHPEFTGDEILWRAQAWDKTVDDEERPGHRRLSSAGFSESSDGTGMSTDLCDACTSVAGYLTRFPRGCGIAQMKVADLLAMGAKVHRTPLCCNPMHVSVWHGDRKKAVRKLAEWVREPDEPVSQPASSTDD
jgi:hypothetical protein